MKTKINCKTYEKPLYSVRAQLEQLDMELQNIRWMGGAASTALCLYK